MTITRPRTTCAAAACALLVALLPAGCGGTKGAAVEGPDQTLFRRHCAACHGPDGSGGQVGQLSVPSLRQRPATERTEAQLFEQISKGSSRGMPPFSYTLTDEEMRRLARFVREEIQRRK
jgi:cytochrome c oxidase cbb3-type subunit 3